MWTKRGVIYSLVRQGKRVSHTQLPVVDTAGNNWRVYYSTRNQQGYSFPYWFEVSPKNPQKILRECTDPILPLGNKGSFDEHGVMPTAILDMGKKKFLYYIGWSRKTTVPYQNAIGLAVSEDGGETFRKYSNKPIIAENVIDPLFVGTLNIINVSDVWYGYYMSCTEWVEVGGRLEPRYLIKLAYSEDGINWRRNGDIAIDYVDSNEGGIVAASVLKGSKQFHMWYCYRKKYDFRKNADNSYRIGYAVSSDGIKWSRRDEYAGIDVGESGWDRDMICYPYVVAYGKELLMFYNGNGFGQSGIGLATSVLNKITAYE